MAYAGLFFTTENAIPCCGTRAPWTQQAPRQEDENLQFYLDGSRPGDPLVEQPHPSVADRPAGIPDEVDVLIVGCGPAGLVLAAQLANFPEIRTAIVDRRGGPPQVGQAHGVPRRAPGVFEGVGRAGPPKARGYRGNEGAL